MTENNSVPQDVLTRRLLWIDLGVSESDHEDILVHVRVDISTETVHLGPETYIEGRPAGQTDFHISKKELKNLLDDLKRQFDRL